MVQGVAGVRLLLTIVLVALGGGPGACLDDTRPPDTAATTSEHVRSSGEGSTIPGTGGPASETDPGMSGSGVGSGSSATSRSAGSTASENGGGSGTGGASSEKESEGGDGASSALEEARCVLFSTSNFSSVAGLGWLDPATREVVREATSLWHDSTFRRVGERLFVLGRLGADNLMEVRLEEALEPAWQRSLGRGANPWDIAALPGGDLVVALYGDGALARLDAEGRELERVSLAGWSEVEDNPEPAMLVRWEDLLLVVLQRLDSFGCGAERGGLLALDAETLEPVPHFGGEALLELAHCNPVATLLRGDTLLVGAAGDYRVRGRLADDGGIEEVDLRSGVSLGVMVSERGLGDRDLVGLVRDEGGGVIALLADARFETAAVTLNEALRPAGELWRSEGLYSAAVSAGRVWLADRSLGDAALVELERDAAGQVTRSRRHRIGAAPVHVIPMATGCPTLP